MSEEKSETLFIVTAVVAFILLILFANSRSTISELNSQIDDLQTQVLDKDDTIYSYESSLEEANSTIEQLNDCMDNIVSDADFDNSYYGLIDAINNNVCEGYTVSGP